MKIGIEAQRIFRSNKHGMDYVVLQEIKELQKTELPIPRERKTMIYNGYNDWFKPTNVKQECSEKAPFFFLGNTDPKKNTERTLIAYSKYLQQSRIKRPIVVADLAPVYLDEITKRNGIENIRQHIITQGYIPNGQLPKFYNESFAFLYTSLRESFGIPLLEAMACGTPVITSNTSSMPEIAGPDAILVNPKDCDEIAKMMLLLEDSSEFYAKQRTIGFERARLFSWRKTAEQLLKVYREIIKGSSTVA